MRPRRRTATTWFSIRSRAFLRHPQPLPVQQRPSDGGAASATSPRWRATADELGELMRLTRHAEIALTEAYRPHGINVGINLGGRPAPASSTTCTSTSCRAGPATRASFGRRQYPRAARGADADGRPAAADLRAPRPGPRLRQRQPRKLADIEESSFLRVFVSSWLRC